MKEDNVFDKDNESGPSKRLMSQMRRLKTGDQIHMGDWIEDVCEWASSDYDLNPERVGMNFHDVWRLTI